MLLAHQLLIQYLKRISSTGCDNHTIAVQEFVRPEFKDTFFRLAWASSFKNTGIRWAATHQATQVGSIVSTQFSDGITAAYMESKNGNNTVNGDITYNWVKHAYTSSLGLRLK